MTAPETGDIVSRLSAAGFLAAPEEAAELAEAAADADSLEALVARRLTGEPLAWVIGSVRFCGMRIRIEPAVYVPRWHTERLARRAAALVPDGGVAVDLCTGSGAIASYIQAVSPSATVVATDIDPIAVACARANGVNALVGDLDDSLPPALGGTVDVLTAVVPYVPTDELHFLPHDVLAFEPHAALDGGDGGLRVLSAVVRRSVRWLRPGGWLLLELGGAQAVPVAAAMKAAGLEAITVFEDEEGDDRAIEGRRTRTRRMGTDPRRPVPIGRHPGIVIARPVPGAERPGWG